MKYLNVNSISIQDISTFQLLQSGNLKGIPDFEYEGLDDEFRKEHNVSRYYQRIGNLTIDDIAIINVLCRPGPVEEIMPKYIEAKNHPESIRFLHPSLEPILSGTYGLIIYKEQIREIAGKIGELSPDEAKLFEKYLRLRLYNRIKPYEEKFIKNAGANCENIDIGIELYNEIDRTAPFCFTKQFAQEKAKEIYYIAYCKAHYPIEFMDDPDKYIRDIRFQLYDNVDIKNNFYTFKNQIIDKFGEFYAKQTEIFFERAVIEANNDLPYNAISDANFAYNLAQYQNDTGLHCLVGFLSHLHIDIGQIRKAKAYLELGYKILDKEDEDYEKDKASFDQLKGLIDGESWKEGFRGQ